MHGNANSLAGVDGGPNRIETRADGQCNVSLVDALCNQDVFKLDQAPQASQPDKIASRRLVVDQAQDPVAEARFGSQLRA